MRLLLRCLLLMLPTSLLAQGYRYDSAVTTAATNVPYGAQAPVYTVPYASVSVFAGYQCVGAAETVYNDQGLTQPMTYPMSADATGRFGFWLSPGPFSYNVATQGGTALGCFNISASGGGTTYVTQGTGITVTGSGAQTTPYVISLTPSVTPLAITSFAGCAGLVEVGTSIVNPAFTATYTGTPTGATITNTDSVGSPLTLASPYTSGTVMGTFTHSAAATATFTLTAMGTSTQTATCTDMWQPAIFGGFGTQGATSAVTASGTSAVLSTGDSLARVQLGPETVGETFGPFTVNGQVIYLLLTGGNHTFIDANSGFPFSFNTPIPVSFTNSHGATETKYLYASAQQLYGTYAPKETN